MMKVNPGPTHVMTKGRPGMTSVHGMAWQLICHEAGGVMSNCG